VARGGEQLALKVGWPQAATRDAALALRHWDGNGAVRLVAADPARGAALLERLDPGRDLATVPVDTACEVAGVLVGRLGRPAPPGLRRLSEQVARQVATLAGSEGLLPRRMVERAGHLAMELVADPACDQRLVHGDLRYGNVLAGEREPWLAVSPRPLAGHPAYEVQPLLRDRVGELGTGSAFRYHVRRRVEVVSDAAGLDEGLVRAWSYLRTAVQAGAATGGSPDVSLDVALLKALEG
jgi:streptomycin 6-kinase